MKLHIFRRTALAVATTVMAGLVAVAPASAAPSAAARPAYPLPPCSVTTNQAGYDVGEIAVITGSGGTPGGTITFIITFSGGGAPVQLVGNVGADGTTVVLYQWPNQQGPYSIVAVCQESQSPPTTVVVEKIPETGSNIGNILRAGGVLLALGAGLLLVSRFRRRQTATA